jgi:hypothetical protein
MCLHTHSSLAPMRVSSHACTSAVYNFARHHIREGFTRVGCEDTTDGDTIDGGHDRRRRDRGRGILSGVEGRLPSGLFTRLIKRGS